MLFRGYRSKSVSGFGRVAAAPRSRRVGATVLLIAALAVMCGAARDGQNSGSLLWVALDAGGSGSGSRGLTCHVHPGRPQFQ